MTIKRNLSSALAIVRNSTSYLSSGQAFFSNQVSEKKSFNDFTRGYSLGKKLYYSEFNVSLKIYEAFSEKKLKEKSFLIREPYKVCDYRIGLMLGNNPSSNLLAFKKQTFIKSNIRAGIRRAAWDKVEELMGEKGKIAVEKFKSRQKEKYGHENPLAHQMLAYYMDKRGMTEEQALSRMNQKASEPNQEVNDELAIDIREMGVITTPLSPMRKE